MEVILGQIFGLFLLIVGLGMLMNPGLFVDAFEDMRDHPGVRLMSALFPVFIGAVIVPLHPAIILNWTLSLSILGYGLLFLGMLRYLFMDTWVRLVSPLMGKSYIRVLGILVFILGGFMAYHAFPMISAMLVA